MRKLVEITNAMDPIHSSSIRQIGGDTVREVLRNRFGPSSDDYSFPLLVIVDGEPRPRRDWDSKMLPTSTVTLVHLPAGFVATAVLAVVLAVTAVAVSLSFSTPTPAIGAVADLPEAAPVYSLSGQSNRIKLNDPIESPYGRVLHWPAYASRPYVYYQDNDQFVNMVLCLGHGKYDVEEILIRETPVENFEGVSYELYEANAKVDKFPTNVYTVPEISNVELYADNERGFTQEWTSVVQVNPEGTAAKKLEFDFVMPSGLYFQNDQGGLVMVGITIIIEGRRVTQDSAEEPWRVLDTFDFAARTTTPQRRTVSVDVEWGVWEVRIKKRRPWTAVGSNINVGPPGAVLVRQEISGQWGWVLINEQGQQTPVTIVQQNAPINHRTMARVNVERVKAYLEEDPHFGDVTILALTMKASNNLNSQTQNQVKVRMTRKLRKWDKPNQVWTEEEPTRSIVWSFVDIVKSGYGGALPDTFLDLDYLYDLDLEFSSENRFFDFIFDQTTTVWAACKVVARAGRAVPMLSGTIITLLRTVPKTTVTALFNQHNIVKNSFQWEVKLVASDEFDCVEVEYVDPRTWKAETITIPRYEGSPNELPERIVMAGITDRDIAYREGLYVVATRRFNREQYTFRTGLEGHIPGYGDLILISSDIPLWSGGGFVEALEGTTIHLENDYDWDPEKSHRIYIRTKNGDPVGPLEVVRGETDREAVTPVAVDPSLFFFDADHEKPIYLIGVQNEIEKLATVTNIQPGEDSTVTITAINYDFRVFEGDTKEPDPLPDTVPPPIPDNPTVTNLQFTTVRNEQGEYLVVWSVPFGAVSFVVETSPDGITWSPFSTPTVPQEYIPLLYEITWVRVAGVNVGQGDWIVASYENTDGRRLIRGDAFRITRTGSFRVTKP